jgi:hypothetical protein
MAGSLCPRGRTNGGQTKGLMPVQSWGRRRPNCWRRVTMGAVMANNTVGGCLNVARAAAWDLDVEVVCVLKSLRLLNTNGCLTD